MEIIGRMIISKALYIHSSVYAGDNCHYAAGEDLRIKVPDRNPNTYELLIPYFPTMGYWKNMS